MATDRPRHATTDPDTDHSQRRALLGSLRAAVESLSSCVEAMHDVIERVDALAGDAELPAAHGRPRVSYGGGRSPLVSVGQIGGPDQAGLGRPSTAGHTNTLGQPGGSGPSRAPGPNGAPATSPPASISPDPDPGRDHNGNRAHDTGELTQAQWTGAATPEPEPSERRTAATPAPVLGAGPGASALMAAADMAHQGYSRDEISARLRERFGDRAAEVLHDLLD